MLQYLSKRISTWIGILVLAAVSSIFGLFIFWQYKKILTMRFNIIEIEIEEAVK